MYLISGKIDSNTLDSWKGKKGQFVRTFGINTKRNSNEWKVSWKSIKQHINTAINRPGIEYEKCKEGKCDLDHVEANTFEGVIKKQKPFERTKIVDFVLDEETETADLIHEVHDKEFFEKLKSGEIQYVSAMVWPATGGYEIHGKGRADLPIVDAEHWQFVHHAFLKDNPAYGKDTAKVKTTCEGSDCQIQMLSSKQFTPSEYDPLSELPILFRHQNVLHLVSASKKVQNIIEEKQKNGIKICEKTLTDAYSTCNESNMKNTSFKACICKNNRDKMADNEKELEAKLKASETEKEEMKAKLKANEDKEKDMESKMKGKYSKLFASEKSDDDAKKMYAKLKSQTEDEKELKAMEDGLNESNKSRKSSEEDPEKKDMKARLQAMESSSAIPLIDSLVSIRKGKMPESELEEFVNGLSSKSYPEIKAQYDNELYLINGLQANEIKNTSEFSNQAFLPFNGSNTKPLASKTLEELSGEDY